MNAENIARMVNAVLTAGKRSGVLAYGKGDATRTVRDAAHILDWRVETLEGPQVNLNDLAVPTSPLSQSIRYAEDSDARHVFVMRDVPPEAMNDQEWFGKLECLADRIALVVETRGEPLFDCGWKSVELEV